MKNAVNKLPGRDYGDDAEKLSNAVRQFEAKKALQPARAGQAPAQGFAAQPHAQPPEFLTRGKYGFI